MFSYQGKRYFSIAPILSTVNSAIEVFWAQEELEELNFEAIEVRLNGVLKIEPSLAIWDTARLRSFGVGNGLVDPYQTVYFEVQRIVS